VKYKRRCFKKSTFLDLLEDVCHHSRPVPVPCPLPHRQARVNQPVEAQLGRGSVPEPGHQRAVVHLRQMGIRLLRGSPGLLRGRGSWTRGGPGGTVQGGHQAAGGGGGPRLRVQRLQRHRLRPGPVCGGRNHQLGNQHRRPKNK